MIKFHPLLNKCHTNVMLKVLDCILTSHEQHHKKVRYLILLFKNKSKKNTFN